MKQVAAAALTLAAIVAGVVLATSLSSSAQEEDSTTTTLDGATPDGRFGFRFDGELPPPLADILDCLQDEGIEIPEDADGAFFFELGGDAADGLADAMTACGLAGIGRPFGGDLPDGFPFGDRFPFHDELPEGFPFGEGFDFEFHHGGLDREALAACLAELGSFEDVDAVGDKLDECLPGHPEGLHGWHGPGFPFGGDRPRLDGAPEDTSA